MSTIAYAESLPRWNRYFVMKCEDHDGPGGRDGILWTHELIDHIDRLEEQASVLRANGRSSAAIDTQISDSEQLLSDMRSAGLDGLDYLPQQIRDADLPPALLARAVEMLNVDDKDSEGQITAGILRRARRRYSNSGRTPGSLRNQGSAIEEINAVGSALGI